ncbi:hypothetical protein [Pseudofrankia sp. BMG5.36]|uniref:hypothetical protein n=1 Tax=Pseudofrankia sp. BMG5.36 TaxID=1834512 RepID=UPI0008DAB4F6|nr:hypothetical protein [Pseudofrankia sp. BMG5.36]OHV57999.1 hypothetical protein BCD48_42535 [Pseudofrankia sp. BMG5.36]
MIRPPLVPRYVPAAMLEPHPGEFPPANDEVTRPVPALSLLPLPVGADHAGRDPGSRAQVVALPKYWVAVAAVPTTRRAWPTARLPM